MDCGEVTNECERADGLENHTVLQESDFLN